MDTVCWPLHDGHVECGTAYDNTIAYNQAIKLLCQSVCGVFAEYEKPLMIPIYKSGTLCLLSFFLSRVPPPSPTSLFFPLSLSHSHTHSLMLWTTHSTLFSKSVCQADHGTDNGGDHSLMLASLLSKCLSVSFSLPLIQTSSFHSLQTLAHIPSLTYTLLFSCMCVM